MCQSLPPVLINSQYCLYISSLLLNETQLNVTEWTDMSHARTKWWSWSTFPIVIDAIYFRQFHHGVSCPLSTDDTAQWRRKHAHQLGKVVTWSSISYIQKILPLTCATMENHSLIKRHRDCPHCGLAALFTRTYRSISAECQTCIDTETLASNELAFLNDFGITVKSLI